MILASLALAAIVPALLLLAHGLIKTRRKLLREGLWAGFVGGVAIGVVVIIWGTGLDLLLSLENLPPIIDAGGHALLVAALPEEGLKFAALFLVVRRFVYQGDVPDVVLASLGIAVGFAVVEDAGYVITVASAGVGNTGMVALVRALSAVPLHVACGLTMGALIGGAVWDLDGASAANQWRLVAALLLPLVMHGTYDFLLIMHQRDPGALWAFQVLPFVLAASTVFAITLCNRALRDAGRSGWLDGASGRRTPATLGSILLLAGAALVGVVVLMPDPVARQAVMVYSVMPLLFGIDLLWTAIARGRSRAA